ncbi:MAG: protein kinase, partial [Myxococcales bacterium]|nr:protein kinase [Myxococcales bacterium]
YPESKVMTRRDEIGRLYNAVFRMGQKLKEKEELESYMAKMNDEAAVFADETVDSQAPTQFDATRTMAEGTPHDLAGLTTTSEELLGQAGAKVLRPGSRLSDRFTVKSVLGAGAMGVVYLADDKVLEEPVAIKMINTDKVSLATIELLKKETRLSRRISHPNVLRNHDFGMVENNYFISMELVVGQTLDRIILRRGALPVRMGLI